MKVLIIGSGGREHAMTWKAAQSTKISQIFVAPGNAGTALEPKTINIAIAADAINDLAEFALKQSIDLTIVGPEIPLVAGIVDKFNKLGLLCCGPNQLAAQLEGSKAFSKDFMIRHHIPTAAYQVFSNLDDAKDYVSTHSLPVVIKASGLAAGKGVVIAETIAQALQVLDQMMAGNSLGTAGQQVVIEEFLTGEEASFIVATDGTEVIILATSQDHKTRDDHDQGPNTGGMGAYSPAPIVSEQLQQKIMQTIILPTIKGMAKDGICYRGFLYAGLMIDKQQIKVLEFNCRLGDPETQAILIRLESDFIDLCQAMCQNNQLKQLNVKWRPQSSLGVVIAAKGYPDNYAKGLAIPSLPPLDLPHGKIFHAGTQLQNGHLVSNGGRVLCVTTLGKTIKQAQQLAYEYINQLNCDKFHYRNDIGYRAIS